MYDSIDLGRIDFAALPKRVIASRIVKAAQAGDNYDLSRRTFYRLLHLGAIMPPQMDQGGKLTWDRDLLQAHVNLDIIKNPDGEWVWFETGKPIPICPGFNAKHEASYRPQHAA